MGEKVTVNLTGRQSEGDFLLRTVGGVSRRRDANSVTSL